jgi:hypothetical protein
MMALAAAITWLRDGALAGLACAASGWPMARLSNNTSPARSNFIVVSLE